VAEFQSGSAQLPLATLPGVFLCTAGTYPGWSVIGNGRNAVMQILGR
jgi:hypothetical protein